MSVQAMSWVLDHSAATGSDRLVLLAIANHCDAQGRDAYPGLQLIADEARVSKRTAIRSIQSLEAAGELRIERGGGAHNTSRYVIVMTPPAPSGEGCQVVTVPDPAPPGGTVTSATRKGDICDRKGDTRVTRTTKNRPEPSTTSAPDLAAAALLLHATEVVVGENDPSVRSAAAVARSRIAQGLFDDAVATLTNLARRSVCSTPAELLDLWRAELDAERRAQTEAAARRRSCSTCDGHGRVLDDDLVAAACPACSTKGLSHV